VQRSSPRPAAAAEASPDSGALTGYNIRHGGGEYQDDGVIDTGLWFMFPVGVAFATIAMMAGIGGAVLFAPFFMLVLKLEPVVALGAGLAIEFFGFSSGVIGYWRKKAICFPVVRRLVMFTVPATAVGVLLGRLIPAVALQAMLAALLVYLAYQFLASGRDRRPKHPRATGVLPIADPGGVSATIKGASLVGGLLVGMISAGLGEINEFNFLRRMKLPVAAASATSVFLVALSATVGASFHAYFLATEGTATDFSDVFSVLVFTVPGVILGAQVGVRLAGVIDAVLMGRFIGGLFAVLAVLTLLLVF